MQNKPLNLLGIAKKAAFLAEGDEQTKIAAQTNRAKLIILAYDASENTKKRAKTLSLSYEIELIEVDATKEEIGKSIGRETCAILALCNKGMAKAFKQKVSEN